MRKVLVTGSEGFIGRRLVEELINEGFFVYSVDCRKSEQEDGNNVMHICSEIDDLGEYKDILNDVEECFHLAWAGNSGPERGNYCIQIENLSKTMKLIEFLEKIKCKRFVGIGSLAEKDVNAYIPMQGSTPNIVSEYGIAKLSAHYFSKAECAKRGIEHVWCLLSNTYGEGNKTNNFINFAAKKMIGGQKAEFTEGIQLYDFVYISDTVRAIAAAGIRGKTNCSYYLGSGNPRELREYIIELRDVIDPKIDLFLGAIPYNGISLEYDDYDCSKLMDDTGYRPEVDFSDGIKRTVKWIKGEYFCNDK